MNPKYSRYYTYISPILKNERIRSYASFIFSLITIVVFSLFAIRPTIGTIIGLQKSIVEQKQILSTLTTKADNLSLGRINLQNINPDTLNKLENTLPSTTDLASLINHLSTIAKQANASVSGIQIQPVKIITSPQTLSKIPKLTEVDFTFNTIGNYQKFQFMLNYLAQSPRLINIQSISISRSSEESLLMSVNAKAFYVE